MWYCGSEMHDGWSLLALTVYVMFVGLIGYLIGRHEKRMRKGKRDE